VTHDHVPPRVLFPKPRPNDLITVPACLECNRASSKDDEYFRLKICMSAQVKDNPDARWGRDEVFRSLERPQAGGLRASFLADTYKVDLVTPAGLYVGRTFTYDVDLQRLFRVAARTVKGLFFHETGRMLGAHYGVRVHSDDTLRDAPRADLQELAQTITLPLAKKQAKAIARGAFAYRFHICEEDPNVSVWALTFYGHVTFLCFTGPVKAKERAGSP
jgi:hypothetical protein